MRQRDKSESVASFARLNNTDSRREDIHQSVAGTQPRVNFRKGLELTGGGNPVCLSIER
jgi:hypothetical protein